MMSPFVHDEFEILLSCTVHDGCVLSCSLMTTLILELSNKLVVILFGGKYVYKIFRENFEHFDKNLYSHLIHVQ